MGVERVAVIQVDFLNRSLDNKIKDVRSRPAEADYRELSQLQLLGHSTNTGATGR